eukprot:COSAG02_NODE_774_length_17325_cov_322.794381_8_plen_160_part_00
MLAPMMLIMVLLPCHCHCTVNNKVSLRSNFSRWWAFACPMRSKWHCSLAAPLPAAAHSTLRSTIGKCSATRRPSGHRKLLRGRLGRRPSARPSARCPAFSPVSAEINGWHWKHCARQGKSSGRRTPWLGKHSMLSTPAHTNLVFQIDGDGAVASIHGVI